MGITALLCVAWMATNVRTHSIPAPAAQLASVNTAVGPQRLVVAAQSEAATARVKREQMLEGIKIEKFSWKKGGFDNVMIATFKFRNDNDFAIKDIEVTCRHAAESGTYIDRNTRTIYQIVKAKSSRVVAEFSMGFVHSQAARSGCTVE